MKPSNHQKIDTFLDDIRIIDCGQVNMVNSIRSLFKETHQALREDIKYGGLVFFKSGVLCAGIFPYKKHISIEFSGGADFQDSSGLLEGKGKRRRHLKIYKPQDITDKRVSYFIQQAVSE
jgi:hypothetical protein